MLDVRNAWLAYCAPIFTGIRGGIGNVLLHSGHQKIAKTSDI
jgi:hypothetical protein